MHNPGDIVLIEATTGNGKHNDPDLFIKGRYEVHHTDEDHIYLKEMGLVIKVQRSKIVKIEVLIK